MFKNNGYVSARVGKIYHYGVPGQIGTAGLDDPPSWDETVNPRGVDKDEEPQLTNYTAARGLGSALAFHASPAPDERTPTARSRPKRSRCSRRHKDRPFFIAAGFYRPHCPYIAPQKIFDMYPLEQIEAPRGLARGARAVSDRRALHPAAELGLTEQQAREAIRAYYASISFMDANVGRLLDALDRLALSDNTIVVFMSDHGYSLGEHGQWMKQMLFEESARSPLILAGPGIGSQGKGSPRMVEYLDLYPTLAGLAGLRATDALEGRSLVPLLNQPTRPWNHAAFTQVGAAAPPRAFLWATVYAPSVGGTRNGRKVSAAPNCMTRRAIRASCTIAHRTRKRARR